MDFRKAQAEAHANSQAKGFYDDAEILDEIALDLGLNRAMAIRRRLILARLAMIASEVGEAVDAIRKDDANVPAFVVHGTGSNPDTDLTGTTHGSELADIVIRTMDLAGYMGIDLQNEIEAKMAKNALREHRHGKLA